MHYRWGVGILLFFHAICGVVSVPRKLALYKCGISECVCGPADQKVVIKCVNRSALPNAQTYGLSSQTEVLDMSGSVLQEMKPMMLSGYNNLMELNLKDNRIGVIDKAALENQSSLIELDLRGNNIKTLPSGVLSRSKLKVLYLANNPFSCNDGNLLGEIRDLMSGNGILEVFDGEMLRCAEPAVMKGRRIIDVLGLQGNKAFRGSLGTAGIIGLTSGIAALLTSLIGAMVILIKRHRSNSKYKYDSLSSMEEDRVEQNQKTSETVVDEQEEGEVLAKRLQKLRRQSQGYPENDNTESDDEDANDQESK